MTGWSAVLNVTSVLVAVLSFLFAVVKYHKKSERAAMFFGLLFVASFALVVLRRDEIAELLNTTRGSVRSSVMQENPGSQSNTLNLLVSSGQPWTPTGIVLHKGQVVTISAAGEVIFSDHDPPTGPDGQGRACYPDPSIHRWTFPARNLSCHSLIGRIGEQGDPFEIGHFKQFRATTSGRFDLGVNDNWFPDNSGAWSVEIIITPLQSP